MLPISYSVRSAVGRPGSALSAVLALALVSFVASTSVMLQGAVRGLMQSAGRDDVAMVLRIGSDGELISYIPVEDVLIIRTAPGVRPDVNQLAEVVVVQNMNRLDDKGVASVQLRGVSEDSFSQRNVQWLSGRMPDLKLDEAAIGESLDGRVQQMRLGETFSVGRDRKLKIVGVFRSESVFDSEVWLGRDVLRDAFRREGYVSSIRAKLVSAEAFDQFKATLEADRRLGVEVLRERAFYEKQSKGLGALVSALGAVMSLLFAIAASVGAAIGIYASVGDRQGEIGTLRAIGFRASDLFVAIVIEALVFGVLGGVLGVGLASLLGLTHLSVMNYASWSEVVLRLKMSGSAGTAGMIAALICGVGGGFFPALRASRLSVRDALRA